MTLQELADWVIKNDTLGFDYPPIYGPYRSFKRAEGDALAWGGTVQPILKPEKHK